VVKGELAGGGDARAGEPLSGGYSANYDRRLPESQRCERSAAAVPDMVGTFYLLGGTAQVMVIPGLGHGGQVFYESQPLLNFVLAD
jgi:hypothetical protein